MQDLSLKSCEAYEATEMGLILEAPFNVGKEKLAAEQRSDASLAECVETAVLIKDRDGAIVGYFWENDMLIRKWKPCYDEQGLHKMFHIVLPATLLKKRVLK